MSVGAVAVGMIIGGNTGSEGSTADEKLSLDEEEEDGTLLSRKGNGT